MTKHAAIYARVSTDDQAERGYSLPSQIEACQIFASQRGFDVAAVYQDDISGARPITSRPEGGELQRAIESRQIKTVIVYCVDRLSRDIVDLLTTVRDWLRAGLEIYALDIGQVTSELDIVLVIKGWQGSDERQKIRERTMRGKITKAKAGKLVGEGPPPYGYKYDHGELLIDELEVQTVRMIYDWYVNGDELGRMMSLVRIAERLTDMGVPTPAQTKGGILVSSASCGRWIYTSVNRILLSETYCGVYHYGNERIPIPVPAIVSRETWEFAQVRRKYNSKIGKRRMKREYLLRGIIFCGCGRRMGGTAGKYLCTRHYNPKGAKCNEPIVVPGEVIEGVVWDYIIGLISNPIEFEEKLREAQAKKAEAIQPKQRELEHVLALLNDTDREADEIAYAVQKVKGIVSEKLQAQSEEVNLRFQALEKRRSELQQALELELTNGTINNLIQFRETVALGLDSPTFEDRRRWLEVLQTTVTVENRSAIVTCRLGGEPMQCYLNFEVLYCRL